MGLVTNGDVPKGSITYVEPRPQPTAAKKEFAPKALGQPSALTPKGWREPLHWTVPPAFEKPGWAMAELGIPAYKEAVHAYYAGVREIGVDRAQKAYSRWVVRHCVSYFETLVRKFQRFNDRHNSEHASKQGMLITPLDYYRSSQVFFDVQTTLRKFQVRSDLRAPMERLLRQKLESLWDLKK
jgi:hypothetical protein